MAKLVGVIGKMMHIIQVVLHGIVGKEELPVKEQAQAKTTQLETVSLTSLRMRLHDTR